jgi:cell division protein FtsJ
VMKIAPRVWLIAALSAVLDVAGGSGRLQSPYVRGCGGASASARGVGGGAGDGGQVRNGEVIYRNGGAASLPRLRGGGLPGFHSWINNMNGHDDYFGQAKASGYRARSAYKLLDLDREHGILKGAKKVVDLAAAPGSWSQVIAERQRQDAPDFPQAEDNLVVAVDLQPMRPIKGVKQLQGDITSPEVADKIRSLVGEGGADLVVCDGAPDITGLHDLDEWCASSLVQSALELASTLLRKGGSFVCKVMIVDASRPTQETLLYSQLRALFGEVSTSRTPNTRHQASNTMHSSPNTRHSNTKHTKASSQSPSRTKLVHALIPNLNSGVLHKAPLITFVQP